MLLRYKAIVSQRYQGKDWVSEEILVGVRCYSVFNKVKLSIQDSRRSLHQGTANVGFPALFTSRRQMSGYLSTSGSIVKTVLTWIPSICLVFPHCYRPQNPAASYISCTSCSICIYNSILVAFSYFLYISYILYILYILYTRSFLVVSYSNSDT